MLENAAANQDFSRTERMSMQIEDQKVKGGNHKHHDDDVSDNINVSEQIKSIEGRQMLLCDIMDSQHAFQQNLKNPKQKN